jgi:hypothetical protein
MPNKLVYIAGSGHSGSTLLNLLLGQHPSCVALGEVHQVLKESRTTGLDHQKTLQALCSCGKSIDQCQLWSTVADEVRSKGITSYAGRYGVLLDTVKKCYGENAVAVDASKGMENLEPLLKANLGLDIKVVHLIRDVRSYTVSWMDSLRILKSKGKTISMLKPKKSALLKLWMNYPSYYFVEWYHMQQKVEKFLDANGVDRFKLGYEELSLYPEKMMERLCGYLGIEFLPQMVSGLNTGTGHVLRGNRMRHRSGNTKIMYDNRWFYRGEWIPSYALFPWIVTYNLRNVYGNTSGTWEKHWSEPVKYQSTPGANQ